MGFIVISILFLIIYLIYWRLSKDISMASRLMAEIDEKSTKESFYKQNRKVKSYQLSTIFSLAHLQTVYFFNQGILLFQGNGEDDHLATWLYFKESDKFFFHNCQSRGRIIRMKEGERKTTYFVRLYTNFLPFQISLVPVWFVIMKEE